MSTDDSTSIEPLSTWLAGKPYWEQYVWHLSSKYGSLSKEQIAQCYQYLCEEIDIASAVGSKREPLSFEDLSVTIPASTSLSRKIRILSVKDIRNVNALSPECTLPIGPHLTLVFGRNGSGKSGIARLLANACFSRGKRDVLPNLISPSSATSVASAMFELEDANGTSQSSVSFTLGDSHEKLKRFSVFDGQSVLIHLDESNRVSFVPPHIVIFDRVAAAIAQIENRLAQDKSAYRKENPFNALFLEPTETSDTSSFCKGLSAATTDDQLNTHVVFEETSDGQKIADTERAIAELKRLDVPARKSQLAREHNNLNVLRSNLESVIARFSDDQSRNINTLIANIDLQRSTIEQLGTSGFDDGVFRTTGSEDWKGFIKAAKKLYDREKEALVGTEPTHCLLCHQALDANATTLLKKYWQFLESEAEAELSRLRAHLVTVLDGLKTLKIQFPKLQESDSGVQVLKDADVSYLEFLRTGFAELARVLDQWIENLEATERVGVSVVTTIDLQQLQAIANAKNQEAVSLTDPALEISRLTKELVSLKHRKTASAAKDKAAEHLAYLRWSAKIDRINFSGIKAAITRKRTESFLSGVLAEYKPLFNRELEELGCDFNLVMFTSGEQGKTVREYRLEFAENYPPSSVLSEGEQNACSLADFLTEVQLDPSNCGVFLDDPVSSLDHERKILIAKRLVREAKQRQVVIFTHDLVFMRKLVDAANDYSVPFASHWIRKVAKTPGFISIGTSPKLASVTALKADALSAVAEFETLGPKDQERALGAAFDYLRSACEGLIEEYLFAKVMQRYDDHVSVQRLEEAIFDQPLAQRVVDMHGELSQSLLAHNRSDDTREDFGTITDFRNVMVKLSALEDDLKAARNSSRKGRDTRKEAERRARGGW